MDRDLHEKFVSAAKYGSIEEVNRFLEDPMVDPSYYANEAIRLVSNNGRIEVVNRLLEDPRVDPSDCGNDALLLASKNGHIKVVNRLLQDPRVVPWYGLILDILRKNNRELEDILLKDPRVRTKKLLYNARYNRYPRIVEILLNDPKIYNDEGIKKDFKIKLRNMKEKRIRIMKILDFHEIPDDLIYEIVLFLHGEFKHCRMYLECR